MYKVTIKVFSHKNTWLFEYYKFITNGKKSLRKEKKGNALRGKGVGNEGNEVREKKRGEGGK